MSRKIPVPFAWQTGFGGQAQHQQARGAIRMRRGKPEAVAYLSHPGGQVWVCRYV
jgi:hypothetical protein